ncbi:short chain dehydrogenase [Eremomyces bilateralis CBS 781.70]|uniref:Short chain dehydrogenase n=1 Tax=Eremomyces bilateralis CBS 781.70 TaxID=1392243 RepID=A0A6G1GHC3_9PEZI|nr:short chain dehydrogenase [Eremomyces bilateralis CBS 781.70]KAF1817453.1 short chain dehydrogenase [Eremomyces bilateralis CBS 781.70]
MMLSARVGSRAARSAVGVILKSTFPSVSRGRYVSRDISTSSTWSSQSRETPPTPQKMPPNSTKGQDSKPQPSTSVTKQKLPEFDLSGKVVLISGGGRGLGLSQAEAVLEAGATVYALDRLEEVSPEFKAVQARAENELGTALHHHRVDVTNVPELNRVVEEISLEHGRLDGLIAAAGVQQETPALEYTFEDANRMFLINITGVFMTAQAVAKQMIKHGNGGSIVLIGSMSGTVVNRGLICPAYNTSKAGVLQLARSLAAEWGEYNIRVNTLSPGYIVTKMVEMLFEEFPEREHEWPEQNMLGRLSKPQEYRGAAVFLLSNASSFMTASDLRMDGGHSAW